MLQFAQRSNPRAPHVARGLSHRSNAVAALVALGWHVDDAEYAVQAARAVTAAAIVQEVTK